MYKNDRTAEDMSSSPDFEESVKMMMEINGVTKEKAILMHLEIWACVHGIGTMLVT